MDIDSEEIAMTLSSNTYGVRDIGTRINWTKVLGKLPGVEVIFEKPNDLSGVLKYRKTYYGYTFITEREEFYVYKKEKNPSFWERFYKMEWSPWNLLSPTYSTRTRLGKWVDSLPGIFALCFLIIWYVIGIPIWWLFCIVFGISNIIIKLCTTPWGKL